MAVATDCGVLRSLKRHPKPALIASTPFVAVHDAAACSGCGTCVGRCQMEALRLEGDTARLDPDRCIGCGLCVTTCPASALSLRRKPEAEQPHVPRDIVDSTIRLGRARGRLRLHNLAAMALRSARDRMAARK